MQCAIIKCTVSLCLYSVRTDSNFWLWKPWLTSCLINNGALGLLINNHESSKGCWWTFTNYTNGNFWMFASLLELHIQGMAINIHGRQRAVEHSSVILMMNMNTHSQTQSSGRISMTDLVKCFCNYWHGLSGIIYVWQSRIIYVWQEISIVYDALWMLMRCRSPFLKIGMKPWWH